MEFTCSVIGCDEDAKIGGMCVPHAREDILAKRAQKAAGQDEEEKDMGVKTANCAECGRELKEGERAYRGKCPDCRSKGLVPRKPKSGKPPARERTLPPPKGSARPKAPPMARASADTVVGQLQAKLLHHIEEAEKIRVTMTTIKELTDAEFEIPEMEI